MSKSSDTQNTFDPTKHLIQLKGKLYLETKYRIQWFREEHPQGCIATEVVSYDPVLVKAMIYSSENVVIATAHAGAVDKGNAVWSGRNVEKAETAAIGRALAHAGYGTQFVEDSEVASGHLADSPIEKPTPAQQLGNGGDRKAVKPLSKAEERAQLTANNGQQKPIEDLRDRDIAARFIQRWRGQSLSDTDVLLALGVSRLSEWTKGRGAADDTINEWLAGKVSQADKDFAAL